MNERENGRNNWWKTKYLVSKKVCSSRAALKKKKRKKEEKKSRTRRWFEPFNDIKEIPLIVVLSPRFVEERGEGAFYFFPFHLVSIYRWHKCDRDIHYGEIVLTIICRRGGARLFQFLRLFPAPLSFSFPPLPPSSQPDFLNTGTKLCFTPSSFIKVDGVIQPGSMRSRENVFTHECSSFKGTRNSFFPRFFPSRFFSLFSFNSRTISVFFFSRGYVSSPGLEYFTDWERKWGRKIFLESF